MQISVINHSNGLVSDEAIQTAIRAINRQIEEDFTPYWGMPARLRLEGRSVEMPDKIVLADMRGDAVLYLWDKTDIANAIGYHNRNHAGVPYGFVFLSVAEKINEPWSVTLSHEALELIADPDVNLLVAGPHPTEERDVFYWYEMCDAVQDETYEIDGVAVSNFVLPLYFTGTRTDDEKGGRNDFLSRERDGATLSSFGINRGGYVGFYDPVTNSMETYKKQGDVRATERLAAKSAAQQARRAVRYQTLPATTVEARRLRAQSGPK